MNKIISQIRDLDLIEKELNNSTGGVLAVNIDNEIAIQIATTFLYRDKNIYIFFNNKNELFDNIPFNASGSFTIIKNEKVKKIPKIDFHPVYYLFSISVTGTIKKVDEQKVVDELKKSYFKKYSKKQDHTKKDMAALGKLIIIDSEEIQALEEVGG